MRITEIYVSNHTEMSSMVDYRSAATLNSTVFPLGVDIKVGKPVAATEAMKCFETLEKQLPIPSKHETFICFLLLLHMQVTYDYLVTCQKIMYIYLNISSAGSVCWHA